MPNYNKANAEIYGTKMVAKCPTCEGEHWVRLKWIGNGMPRIYCDDCKRNNELMQSGLDNSGEYHKYAAISTARGAEVRANERR